MSENGLEAISRFAAEGIKTNCTLIFTANQGLLAAKAGASLLSPFVGRVDDINEDGMRSSASSSEIVDFYELDAEVLTASVRRPRHVTEAALAGSHIATLPFKVLQQMVHHPLTDKGIVKFKQDWEPAARARRPSRPDRTRPRRTRAARIAATRALAPCERVNDAAAHVAATALRDRPRRTRVPTNR